MVKFSFIALAVALASTTLVSAAGSSTVKKNVKLSRNLLSGKGSTKALLKHARPYKKKGAKKVHGRRAEEEEFEITGDYYLEFSKCLDLKTYDEDLFDEDLYEYSQAGKVVSTKSYVLFHVCTSDTCYLDAEDDLYMVDLATYLTNVAQYHANKRSDFCEQCEQFNDYCNPQEEEEEEEEEEADDAEEGDEEGRKLKEDKRKKYSKKIERKLANKNYIDCNKCESYECFVDEEDLDDNAQRRDELDEQVSEWIGELAECQETGVQWNDMDLYTGAMCSPYGDGVELAVFVNEECTMYTNQMAFSDVYNPYANDNDDGGNNINYLTYAENFIKAAFAEITPCYQVQYDDPDEEDDEDQDEEEEQNEATEYCQAVMQDDAVSFSACEADEEEEEEADEDDEVDTSWYTYDMKEADDINQVCAALNALDAETLESTGHVYDEQASGSWYTRNKKGSIVYGDEPQGGLSGGIIALIVIAVAAVVGGAAFLAFKKSDRPVESDYQGGAMS